MIEGINRTAYTAQQQAAPSAAKKGRSFSELLEQLKTENAQLSAAKEASRPALSARLQGEYLSSFEILNPNPSDRRAEPKGMGAESAAHRSRNQKTAIDKTSDLYQQALELESYFVKIMLDSMRSTLHKTSLTGKDSFAGKMYDDMMYEELSRTVTKSAGLGLADQIYLQLNTEG
ncbi:MAG: rod-binding protein [Treponema sp.]